ncbi:hypothetical protein SJAG_04286 [Schizosaccharomyces japonicus yFS275]|uniref:Thc1 RRM domain-containing protein n=1 Tax=Schizosaccharomyces japonicus (strain yFS275 / FY16936) TaxID=402676 RepID=B6K6F4_SCHJY|nr:hypothetical protein SJAG_04286 [Schizosaccharomyces japonicus yFS275]EEB09108.1 hypothetical protein SJAG_04286 [Schizosaccharomyces japonicus yFS275]
METKNSVLSNELKCLYIRGLYLTEKIIRKYFSVTDFQIQWIDDLSALLKFKNSNDVEEAYYHYLSLGSVLNALVKPIYGTQEEITNIYLSPGKSPL